MMISPINYSIYLDKQNTPTKSFKGVTQVGEKVAQSTPLKEKNKRITTSFMNIFKRITTPKTPKQKELLNQYFDSLATFTKGGEQQKVLKFLHDNIVKVQDNHLIHFCILNAIDKDKKVNFDGFMQLYETSECVYEMMGDLCCCERDKRIINEEIIPKYAHKNFAKKMELLIKKKLRTFKKTASAHTAL